MSRPLFSTRWRKVSLAKSSTSLNLSIFFCYIIDVHQKALAPKQNLVGGRMWLDEKIVRKPEEFMTQNNNTPTRQNTKNNSIKRFTSHIGGIVSTANKKRKGLPPPASHDGFRMGEKHLIQLLFLFCQVEVLLFLVRCYLWQRWRTALYIYIFKPVC